MLSLDDWINRAKEGTIERNSDAFDLLYPNVWWLIVKDLDRASITRLCSTSYMFKQWCEGGRDGYAVWDKLAAYRYGAPLKWDNKGRDERNPMSRFRAYAIYKYLRKTKAPYIPFTDKLMYRNDRRRHTISWTEHTTHHTTLVDAIKRGIIPNDVEGVTISQRPYGEEGKRVTVTWRKSSLAPVRLNEMSRGRDILIEFITFCLNRNIDIQSDFIEQIPQLDLIRGGICSVCNVSMCNECFETHQLKHE